LEAGRKLVQRRGDVAEGLLDAIANLVKRTSRLRIVQGHDLLDVRATIAQLKPGARVGDEVEHATRQLRAFIVALQGKLRGEVVQIAPSKLRGRQAGGGQIDEREIFFRVGSRRGEFREGATRNLDGVRPFRRTVAKEFGVEHFRHLLQAAQDFRNLSLGIRVVTKLVKTEKLRGERNLFLGVGTALAAEGNECAGRFASTRAALRCRYRAPRGREIRLRDSDSVEVMLVARAILPRAGFMSANVTGVEGLKVL